jgi:hypothetical protein
VPDDVKVPKVGKMNKKVIIPIVLGAAAYIGWRYYQASKAPAAPVDPGMQDPGTLPGVTGAVPTDNSFGSNTGGTGGSSSQITTNAQWSDVVTGKLAGDQWTNSQIATAIGNFLTSQPLSDDQQSIVRAAIGVAGYPPVGSFSIIPGGNTGLNVAPTGLTVSGITPTTAVINFLPISGARTYNVYRSGASSAVGTGANTPISLQGLEPGTSYSVQVAGVNGAGTVGPKSSPVSFKTTAAVAVQPAQPTVVSVTKDRATLRTGSIPLATSYRWLLNNKLANVTDGPMVTLTQLHPNSVYSVAVQSDTATGSPSKSSAAKSFRTAKK